jgi:sec-independent protein translocase protein TatA
MVKVNNMLNSFALLDLGAPELLIILAIILVLFGGNKLPELSKSLGSSIKEFKGAAKDANAISTEIKTQVSEIKQAVVGEAPKPLETARLNTENAEVKARV